ncbi:MAG: hypothetical protein QOC80_617, partial [Frankiaceae bacterium]|nr:hypothetical protein [Frankiaceae bacterium]
LVLAAMVVWGVVVWRAAPRLPHAPDARRGSASPTWAWCAVVVVEVALIVGGQRVLTRVIHHAEWAPVWTLFVVGVHFVPFARIFGARTFNRLALALCALAAGTLVVAGMFGISSAWYTVPGFGGALILWAAALSGLASAWFGPRRVDPVGSP